MGTKRCFIYCAGDYYDSYAYPAEGDMIAAADRGYELTRRLGIEPDIIAGDFDSLGYAPDCSAEVIRLPCEKDDTDLGYACTVLLERGYKLFNIIGAVGGRPDHTYANLQLLSFLARRGAQGYLFADGYVFTAVRNSALEFDERYRGYVSLFACEGDAQGVSVKGLKYQLDGYLMRSDVPLGVSNEFVGRQARVSVSGGSLLIMFERKEALPLPVVSALAL